MFAFPRVNASTNNPTVSCEFVMTAVGDTTVHIQAPAVGLNDTEYIAGGTSLRQSLSCNDLVVNQGKESKAIIIKSDLDIQIEVTSLNNGGNGDSFLLLPIQPYFTQFVTATYFANNPADSWDAMVIVIPSEPDTTVTFYRYVIFKYVLGQHKI